LNLFVTDPGTWGIVECGGTIQPSEYSLYHCGEEAPGTLATELTTQFLITMPGSGSIDIYGGDFSNPNSFVLQDAAGNSVGNLIPESPAPVPEPASITLLVTGAAAAYLKRRRSN
jgi:hypothetical protein